MAGEPRQPDIAMLVQSLPVAVLLVRPDGLVHQVNAAAEGLFEQGAKRLIGQPVRALLRFEDQRVNEALSNRELNIAAHRMRLQLGRDLVKTVDVSLTQVSGHEGWQLLTVSESGAGANLFEQDHAGEGFAVRGPDILAHEIKNPLAAIKGAAQLLERQSDEGGRRLTELIRAEVDRIALLIDQMQSLTRQTQVPAAPCNIYEPIARAREILETAHPGKLRIIEDFDPSIPAVLVPMEHLVQVLLNLMTNAQEALATTAEPQITLATKFVSGVRVRLNREGHYVQLPVEIRVTDNGPGVDPRLAEDIFSPFVTSKKGGQGLGLALVQKLVRDMNGRIVHDRDTARGLTHFRLFLPLAGH